MRSLSLPLVGVDAAHVSADSFCAALCRGASDCSGAVLWTIWEDDGALGHVADWDGAPDLGCEY